MPKNAIALGAVVGIAVIVNLVGLFNIGAPLFLDFVPTVPPGISCQGCETPQVQEALSKAAAAGRAQIQHFGGTGILWWAFGIIVVNLIAAIAAWRLGRGSGTV